MPEARIMARISKVGVLASVLGALLGGSAAIAADEAAKAFFKGKRISLLVGTTPASSNDILARVMARYLAKHLADGSATVIVQNMPGSGAVTMMNYLANVAERNGTVMGQVVGGIYMRHHFDPGGIRHKLSDMIPIFNPEGSGAVIYGGAHLRIKQPQDILSIKKPIAFGFQSPEGNSAMLGMAGFTMLGVPYRGISGYKGTQEIALAVERGELDAGWNMPGAYHQTIKPKIDAGLMVPLFQSGLWRPEDNRIVPDPSIPDVPTFDRLYRELKGADPSGPLWDAWFMPLISYARYTIFYPPGVPNVAVDAMTLGLEAICADPEYQAEVRRIDIDPKCYLKDEARAITARAAAAPPGAVTALEALLQKRK